MLHFYPKCLNICLSFTHLHTPMVLAGAIWGSVFCSRRSLESNGWLVRTLALSPAPQWRLHGWIVLKMQGNGPQMSDVSNTRQGCHTDAVIAWQSLMKQTYAIHLFDADISYVQAPLEELEERSGGHQNNQLNFMVLLLRVTRSVWRWRSRQNGEGSSFGKHEHLHQRLLVFEILSHGSKC